MTLIKRLGVMLMLVVMSLGLVVGSGTAASAHPTKDKVHEVVVHRGGLPDGCSVTPRWGSEKMKTLGIGVFRAHCLKDSEWKPMTQQIREIQICSHPALLNNPCHKWFPWRALKKDQVPVKDWVNNEVTSIRFPMAPHRVQMRVRVQSHFAMRKDETKRSTLDRWNSKVFTGVATIGPAV